MNKPHIRVCERNCTRDHTLYHCSMRQPGGGYWHTYGKTWQIALDKMDALIQKHRPSLHGPSNA